MTHSTELKKPTIVGIVVSPIETLKRIRNQPIFWGTAIILFVVSLILFGVVGYYQVNDPKFLELINKQMPQEIQALPEAEQQATMELIKKINFATVIIMGGVSAFLFPLLWTVFLKCIFFFMKHKKVTFRQLFSFQVHIYTISVLAILVHAITVAAANGNPEISPTSLAGVLPITNGLLKAILIGFDLFIFWTLILLKLGLEEVAQLSSRKSWVITVVAFVLMVALQVIAYLISQ